jgi:hypothetical protein
MRYNAAPEEFRLEFSRAYFLNLIVDNITAIGIYAELSCWSL